MLPAIKTHDDLWDIEHETVVNEQIRERNSKQREESQRKKQTIVQFRSLSVDLLAHDWLSLQQFDLEATIYLIEKTLPTLVLGVEKLTAHVHKLGLVEVGAVPDFNPINFLAQFLMRNNPRFNISLGSNSYTNTLKDAIVDIKTDFYAKQNNRFEIIVFLICEFYFLYLNSLKNFFNTFFRYLQARAFQGRGTKAPRRPQEAGGIESSRTRPPV